MTFINPMTPKLARVTIVPAKSIPATSAGRAYRNLIPNTKAATAPVHIPVPGSGMPTNIANPTTLYFSMTFFPRRRVRSKSQLKKRSKNLIFRSRLVTGSNRRSTGTIGIAFPNTAQNTADCVVRSVAAKAQGMAPLSSTTGSIPMMNVIH